MLLEAKKSSLLVIDVQERLLPAMVEGNEVVSRTRTLVQAAKALDVPVTVSEQYPKGLGATVAELRDNEAAMFEKMSFSIWKDAVLKQHFIDLHEASRPLVVVAGIEAHVCVLQSAIELRTAGFGVYVVADAIASRKQSSADAALERMRDTGIQIVTTEMVVFEWLEKAGTPEFKQLSGLIR